MLVSVEDMGSEAGKADNSVDSTTPSGVAGERNQIERLMSGLIHWFSDWPTGDVPRSGAVVYTILN